MEVAPQPKNLTSHGISGGLAGGYLNLVSYGGGLRGTPLEEMIIVLI